MIVTMIVIQMIIVFPALCGFRVSSSAFRLLLRHRSSVTHQHTDRPARNSVPHSIVTRNMVTYNFVAHNTPSSMALCGIRYALVWHFVTFTTHLCGTW